MLDNLKRTDVHYNSVDEDDDDDNDGPPDPDPLGLSHFPLILIFYNQQPLLCHPNLLLLHFHPLKIYLHHCLIACLQEKKLLQVQQQPQENK